MVKNPISLAPDIRPDRPRRRILPILSLFVAGPLLLPIVIDIVSICRGQWCEVLGFGSPAVRTPTLNALGEWAESAREVVVYHISSRFQRVPWNPSIVLPVAVAIMVLAMVMLRL